MRFIIYCFLLFILNPLICSPQILDNSFKSQEYKYIDYTNESNSYEDKNSNNTLIIKNGEKTLGQYSNLVRLD